MINFLKFFSIIFLITECNLIGEYNQNSNLFYLLSFFLLLTLNYFFNKNSYTRIDIDLLFKYFNLIGKTPNFLINFVFNTIKKIILYLLHFKYKHIYNTIKILSKKYFLNFFLFWRPIFKKTSYFGYYRANRSKWIK